MDVPAQDIAALVKQAQAGDRDSLALLFERLQGRIFRFFAIRTSNHEMAEDLTQTTFLEMIRALPRYKVQSDAKFTTWLFQIARFRLIDYYRKLGRTVAMDEVPEPEVERYEPADPVLRDQLDLALQKLPEPFQTVLHLRYREDLDTADIAAAMKTSQVNARVLHHRALKALQRMFPDTQL